VNRLSSRSFVLLAAAATARLRTDVRAGVDTSAPQPRNTLADRSEFQASMSEFVQLRAEQPDADQLDWPADPGTRFPNRPPGSDIAARCDFGASNYPKQGRMTEDTRRIDDHPRMLHGEDTVSGLLRNSFKGAA
jgi:hypothetical protein